jgi:hypothetical protein
MNTSVEPGLEAQLETLALVNQRGEIKTRLGQQAINLLMSEEMLQ